MKARRNRGGQNGLLVVALERINDVYSQFPMFKWGESGPTAPQNIKQLSSRMKQPTDIHNERIATMKFSSVYPHYVTKVEKNGRTIEELHTVIEWLTGYDEQQLAELIDSNITFEEFFETARLNPNAHLITGVICGYRVEEIENSLTQKTRYLDKLAKGRKMNKILRDA